jgi:hypothetical protein
MLVGKLNWFLWDGNERAWEMAKCVYPRVDENEISAESMEENLLVNENYVVFAACCSETSDESVIHKAKHNCETSHDGRGHSSGKENGPSHKLAVVCVARCNGSKDCEIKHCEEENTHTHKSNFDLVSNEHISPGLLLQMDRLYILNKVIWCNLLLFRKNW